MASQSGRGRDADHPYEIPRLGWRDILLRLFTGVLNDHISIVAAGVAFYGMLALFPAIAAVISVAGLVLDRSAVEGQLAAIAVVLPESAAAILTDQARQVVDGSDTGIGLALAGSIALSLVSASFGMRTLMEGMNIAYDERERRGFLRLNVTALALTTCLVMGFAIGFATVLTAPRLLQLLGLSRGAEMALTYGRWPVLALLSLGGLSVLYRFGPSRRDPQWQWVSLGAALATALWTVATFGFSVYVNSFAHYNETYGALGGVIVLLTWLWLSAFIVLLGAELNAEMEHQTAVDTTVGRPKPMGQRGAVKADTLGPVP
ncbi:MAG: YihY/virulence factor BrkB family protein [Roseivivax sp.]|nr:YihY/virulence factor BrkB family protein [Roseivivax sp.]